MEDKLKVLIPEEEINKRIRELAAEINRDYAGEAVHLVCILKGSVLFTAELAKRITIPCTMDFMRVSSYGSGTVSSGNIQIKKDLEEDISGKNVIVIEDIVDSGKTLSYLAELLKVRKPKTLEICTLLDKPSRRERFVEAKYIGFQVEDRFVVGFGLDYDQKYRNLPYVAQVIEIGGQRVE